MLCKNEKRKHFAYKFQSTFLIGCLFCLLQSHDSWQGHDSDQVSIYCLQRAYDGSTTCTNKTARFSVSRSHSLAFLSRAAFPASSCIWPASFGMAC